jgi:hypothetical protein
MLAAVVVEQSVPSLSCGFQRASRPHQSVGLFYVLRNGKGYWWVLSSALETPIALGRCGEFAG